MVSIKGAVRSVVSGVKSVVTSIAPKKATSTQTTIKPTTASVRVTDFTSGESVTTKTTTSPSGTTSTRREVRSAGGGRVSEERAQQLISETKKVEKSLGQQKVEKLDSTRRREERLTPLKSVLGERPLSTLERVERRRGLEGISQSLSSQVGRRQTISARQGTARTGITNLKTLKREAEIVGLVAARQVVNTGIGFKNLIKSLPKAPKKIVEIVRNPENVVRAAKGLPRSIKQGGERFGTMVRTSPSEAIAVVGTEVFILRGTGKAIKVTGRLTGQAAARLSPDFVGAARTGTKIKIAARGGRSVNLKVVGRIPTESLRKQVSLAGRRITAVSSQQDALVGLIRRSRVVRKPIQNEASLSSKTKRLLKKFDNKKITGRELAQLDLLIKRQRGKGILERSFFADPRGRVRPSRLGIVKDDDAKLIDILSGDVRFTGNKPQILVFRDVRVEKLPKSFRGIKSKLRRGVALTRTETNRLLIYQQRQTGRFKPIGFVSREAEVSLAPGELIRRQKRIGVTLINGRRVPIIAVRVVKPTRSTKKLLSKAQRGTITKSELSKLRRKLKRETGFKIPASSVVRRGKVFSLRRFGASVSSRALSKARSRPRLSSRFRSRPTSRGSSRPRSAPRSRPRSSPRSRPRSRPRSGVSSRPKSRPRSRPSGSSVGRFARTGKTFKIFRRKGSRRLRKEGIRGPAIGYNVYGKIRGKSIKLNKRPLTERDALSRGAWAIDHSTARTYTIKKAGRVRNFGSIKKKEKSYISKAGRKFRSFRIRGGRKIALSKKFIEKRRHLIDTRGEKRGLTLSRLARREGFIRSGAARHSRRIKRSHRKSSRRFLSRYRPRKRSSARRNFISRRRSRRRPIRRSRPRSMFTSDFGFFSGSRRTRSPARRSFRRSSHRRTIRMRSRPTHTRRARRFKSHRSSFKARRRATRRSRRRGSRSVFSSDFGFFR